MCISGLFFAFVFGVYYVYSSNYEQSIPARLLTESLFAGWQAAMTGILLYYFIDCEQSLKRFLNVIFWAVIVAIIGSMLWISVIFPEVSPDINVNNMLESIVHSKDFPSGSNALAHTGVGKDMFNREQYPKNYLVTFSEPTNRSFQGFIITLLKETPKEQPKDSCFGDSIGSKKITDSFSICYLYPSGNSIGGVDMGIAKFDGFLNPERTIWAHVETDAFLDPTEVSVPDFVKYYTGYTDAQFVEDIIRIQKVANVTIKIPPTKITFDWAKVGQTVKRGETIPFGLAVSPSGKYDVGYFLTTQTDLYPIGKIEAKFSTNRNWNFEMLIPSVIPAGYYRLIFYLLPSGALFHSTTTSSLQIIATTSSEIFLLK